MKDYLIKNNFAVFFVGQAIAGADAIFVEQRIFFTKLIVAVMLLSLNHKHNC